MALPHDPDLDPVAPPPVLADDDGGEPTDAGSATGRADSDNRLFGAPPDIAFIDPSQWQTSVQLSRPLTVDGVPLASITVRALTGNEVVNLVVATGGDETRFFAALRALSAGVHPAVLERLSADDYSAVLAAQRPFLPRLLRDDPDAAGYVADVIARGTRG